MKHNEAEFPLDEILVDAGRRPIDPEVVDRLADSIRTLGLRTPLTVRLIEGVAGELEHVMLVAGRHRLEALRQLGIQSANCVICPEDDEVLAELWEISENLHRSELSALDQANQLKRWCELHAQNAACDSSENVQCAGHDSDDLRQVDAKRRGGRPRSAHYSAGKALNLNRKQVERLNAVSTLSEEAQVAAKQLGLETNLRALLRAAKSADQVAALKLHAAEKAAWKANRQAKRRITTRTDSGTSESGEAAGVHEIDEANSPSPPPSENRGPLSVPVEDNVISLPVLLRFQPRDRTELSVGERKFFGEIRDKFAVLDPDVKATVLMSIWSESPADVREYFLAHVQVNEGESARYSHRNR